MNSFVFFISIEVQKFFFSCTYCYKRRILSVLNHPTSVVIFNTGGYYSVDWTTGLLDWNTGLDYWTDIFLVFAHSMVGFTESC